MGTSSITHGVTGGQWANLAPAASRSNRWRGGLLVAAVLTTLACDDKLGVVGQHLDGGDEDSGPSVLDADWEIVAEELPQALFSVWGTTADDIWVVGSDAGDGPLVMHYDGKGWDVLDTGAEGDLWWVSGEGDEVWMSGANGLVLRYDRSDEQFEAFELDSPITAFGVQPFAADDVWAVGGEFMGDVGRAAYHFDGEQFSEVDVPSDGAKDPVPPFFKIWGRSSDDLWIVGFGTSAYHKQGDDWQLLDVPTGRRLFTVHGNDDYVAAVGGSVSGLLVEFDGDELVDVTPDAMPQMNGIWVQPNGDAIAGGFGGFIYERVEGEWQEVLDVPFTPRDYHAVFVDSDGGQWAVGGQVTAPPYSGGILAHRGAKVAKTGLPASR